MTYPQPDFSTVLDGTDDRPEPHPAYLRDVHPMKLAQRNWRGMIGLGVIIALAVFS
jgi:hypothetical protein